MGIISFLLTIDDMFKYIGHIGVDSRELGSRFLWTAFEFADLHLRQVEIYLDFFQSAYLLYACLYGLLYFVWN